MSIKTHSVLILGAGAGGLTVAARLKLEQPELDVAVIDPSEKHYYQPLWTLVGGGVFDRSASERDQAELIPSGVTWVKAAAATIDPEKQRVMLTDGSELGYEQLVVAAGLQLNWDAVKGLAGRVGRDGICSNYSWDTVESTWEGLSSITSGRLVFTHPSTPIKCGGAPQKIAYLAEDHLRRKGVRNQCEVVFATASPGIFPIDKYARTLRKVIERKQIDARYGHDLIEVKADEKVAVFSRGEGEAQLELEYDLLHVTPPQGPPDFLKSGPLANADGWVDVHKDTTQHLRHPDVFALGDCSSLPTSKTAAAIRKQAPTLVANLLARRRGAALTSVYDGYTSCPLVTGYGSLILAEFDYDGNPAETFPFDQSQERYSMYVLKARVLPDMYWHGMLKGRA